MASNGNATEIRSVCGVVDLGMARRGEDAAGWVAVENVSTARSALQDLHPDHAADLNETRDRRICPMLRSGCGGPTRAWSILQRILPNPRKIE